MPYVLIPISEGQLKPPIYFESLEDAQARFNEMLPDPCPEIYCHGYPVYYEQVTLFWLYKNGLPGQAILSGHDPNEEAIF